MITETEPRKKDIRKTQIVNVANFVYSKFTKHIQNLKNIEGRSITSQTWILNAIKKKIDKDEKIQIKDMPKNKYLCVKIDPISLEKINKQVNALKKHNSSYSKTKWIVEAILEQLEEEQENLRG